MMTPPRPNRKRTFRWEDAAGTDPAERAGKMQKDAAAYKQHISSHWGAHELIDSFPYLLATNDTLRWKILFDRYGVVVTGVHPQYRQAVQFNFQKLRERLFCIVEPRFATDQDFRG
jgi:hypothetical protein